MIPDLDRIWSHYCFEENYSDSFSYVCLKNKYLVIIVTAGGYRPCSKWDHEDTMLITTEYFICV